METIMIQDFNSMVSQKSTTVILGDLAWKDHGRYLQMLKGKKILVRGNHDDMPKKVLNNFTLVSDLLRTKVRRRDVSFCHYPLMTWASSVHGSWNIHGHSHGRIKPYSNFMRLDVSCNIHGYRPLPWEYVEFLMFKKLTDDEYKPNDEAMDASKKDAIKALWFLTKKVILGRNRKFIITTDQVDFMSNRNAKYWEEFKKKGSV